MESGDESGGGAGADELPLHAPRPRRALQVGEGRPGVDESRDNNVDDDNNPSSTNNNNSSSSRSGLFARLGWAVGAALRLAEAGLGALGLYSRFSYVREAVAAGELVLLQGDEGEDTRRPLEPAELEAVIGAEEEEGVLEELDEEGERAYLGGEDAVVGGEDCLDEAGHVVGGCEDTGCSDEDGDDDDLVYGGGSDGEAA